MVGDDPFVCILLFLILFSPMYMLLLYPIESDHLYKLLVLQLVLISCSDD